MYLQAVVNSQWNWGMKTRQTSRQADRVGDLLYSFTHILTHTHTHMINCINYCMVTTFILFILIYLMRSCPGIVLIMPGNHFHCNCDKLWQHTHTHTNTYTDAGAWTRSSCRFLWAFIVLYKLLFFRIISPHYDDFQLTHSARALSMKPFVGAAT